jgi:hypothetical protein
MQIKTQKQMATLQNKAQKVANNLDEVVIAKGAQQISRTNSKIVVKNNNIFL